MVYRPMTLVDLAGRLASQGDERIRWKHVWEFFEEFRWAPVGQQPDLFRDEPERVDDDRWNVLLAAIAEHLSAQLDLAPPEWSRGQVLATPWFPSSLASKRMEALVTAPAAFRKHGVYLAARDLEAA
nr:hypothetical protein Ade03nite_09460 [Actinoplanes derwentensis]